MKQLSKADTTQHNGANITGLHWKIARVKSSLFQRTNENKNKQSRPLGHPLRQKPS